MSGARRSGTPAAAGAAVGLSLTLGEVWVGYLAGGRFPLAWWGFLAAYYVPALALAGAALGLARLRGRPVRAGEAARLLADGLVFLYLVVAANHELLKGLAALAPPRLATVVIGAMLAWLHARRFVPLARRASATPGDLVFQLARPLLLPLVAWGAIRATRLEGGIAAALVFLALAHAALEIAGRAAAALLLAGAPRRRIALGSAGIVLGLVCGRGLAALPPGTFRDEPQPSPAPARDGRLPNVVLIVLDTVGAADLSPYGREPAATPRLADFARKAVVHGLCLSSSPWSVPSHASLFTGLYPPQHGADFDLDGPPCRPRGLAPRFETLAEALARRGYATAAVVANQPTFDPVFGLDRGFRYLDARLPRERVDSRFAPLLLRLEGRLPPWALSDPRVRRLGVAWRPAEAVVDEALAWLGRRPAAQPYFLFLSFMDAHTPYAPRAGRGAPGRSPRLPLYGRPDGRWDQPLSAEESGHVRALRSGAIRYLDGQVGRLLDSLERLPGWADTWVVITSDHGESVSEGRLFGHNCATLSQEVLHVPLIVRDPRAPARAGTRDDRPAQLVDVALALRNAAGLPAPAGPGGVPIGSRRTLLALGRCNCPRLQPGAERGPAEAIVEDGCKYVEVAGAPVRLFDLASDPEEARDLAASDPERLERLRRSLERWRRELGAPPAGPADPAGRSGEALRALGYVR